MRITIGELSMRTSLSASCVLADRSARGMRPASNTNSRLPVPSDAARAPNPEIRARSLGTVGRYCARLPPPGCRSARSPRCPARRARQSTAGVSFCRTRWGRAQRRLRRRQRRETRRRVPGVHRESFCDVSDRNEPRRHRASRREPTAARTPRGPNITRLQKSARPATVDDGVFAMIV